MIVLRPSTRVSPLIVDDPSLVIFADRLEFPLTLALVLSPVVIVPFEEENGALKAVSVMLGIEIDNGVMSMTVLGLTLQAERCDSAVSTDIHFVGNRGTGATIRIGDSTSYSARNRDRSFSTSNRAFRHETRTSTIVRAGTGGTWVRSAIYALPTSNWFMVSRRSNGCIRS